MKSDIEIANETPLLDIDVVARGIGIKEEELESFGKHKAKVSLKALDRLSESCDGKLILVTATTPTPSGEGKTTTTIGLGDALTRLDERVMIAIREPSMGPVFGRKGGATGGGMAQVAPMEDINLHFTGDMHAVSSANNLLAALVDNHIFQGNKLDIDPARVTWRRCMDMNDRQIRRIHSGLGKNGGVERSDGFDITAASEVMAILCLTTDIKDLKARLKRIVIGATASGKPVTAGDLHAEGPMAMLLKEAIKPNLVQTLEHTPALVHGGPFANIAHGCSSIMATRLGLKLADYVVTEAGFGADLGAEKFLNIKCRKHGIWPNAVVIVTTVRALKYHGGADAAELSTPDTMALSKGLPNLSAHVENITKRYGLPAVVAVNAFHSDSQEEKDCVVSHCESLGVRGVVVDCYRSGSQGSLQLAQAVMELCMGDVPTPKFLYEEDSSIEHKIEVLAKKVYGAEGVEFSERALGQLADIRAMGLDGLPVCMAKTPMSLSDDPSLRARPQGFTVHVKALRVSAGAGFIVVLTGAIVTMPGLPKKPCANYMDIDGDGVITGLS